MATPNYTTYPYLFTTKGVFQRYAIDRLPDHGMWNQDNTESRQENSIASRLGRMAITQDGTNNTPLSPANIHTLSRLKSLDGNAYRYAGAGTSIFRRVGNSNGPYTEMNTPLGTSGMSGQRISVSPYRPNNTSFPYDFFADADQMLKDNGMFSLLELWGIFPPLQPPTLEVLGPLVVNIDDFGSAPSLYTAAGFSGALSSTTVVNTTLGTAITTAPGIFTVTPASMVNIIANSQVSVGAESDIVVTSVTSTTFTAQFNLNHAASDTVNNSAISGTIVASSVASILRMMALDLSQFPGGAPANDSDFINIGLQLSSPLDFTSIQIIFDVGNGDFVSDTYSFSFPTFTEETVTVNLPPPIGTKTYTTVVTNFGSGFTEVPMQRGSFIPTGQAGNPGHTWANVNGWKIVFTTNATGGATVLVNDFFMYGGSGPDVTGNVADYDYRITYFNLNTGDESGPSVILVNSSFVAPTSQAVLVEWIPSPDPQVTHTRVYRRGGSLPGLWLQVGQVPVGTNFLVDGLSDQDIADNNILNVDTAPPVTSTLAVPVNTTLTAPVAVGLQTVAVANIANLFPNQFVTLDSLTTSEETVIVSSVGVGTITAFFQLPHSIGATVEASTQSGTPVNIGTIAFDRAWLAGDPNNPNILYYSDRFNPESFPLENFLEIGVPSDPIMGVLEWNGQLYVFTQTTVWNLLGAIGGTVPLPYKTAAKHGLAATYGWCITEGELWYQSFGGIYSFQGSASEYASEPIEWVFTDQFISDTLQRSIVPQDPTQVSQTLMSYYQNEIYVSYVGTDGNRHRVIWHKIYKRWRNDDVPANAMIVEDDIYTLLFGDMAGMIYQDRVGNFDDAGFSSGVQQFAPISFNLQTAALDLGISKNFKVFNELTLDLDTAGLDVDITLLFDYGLTPVSLGTINTGAGGRDQYQFNINEGDGQLSLNVSLQLTATIDSAIANPITVYEAYIRATPEAELRESFDSYIEDYGSPDWKIVKQGYFEYFAPDPAGIAFSCYIQGSSVPQYSFTLPQAVVRTSKRVRFPATKAQNWRWVATSSSPFRLYSDSRLEYKKITNDNSYQLRPLQQETATQP
jgi:hypothetical protein